MRRVRRNGASRAFTAGATIAHKYANLLSSDRLDAVRWCLHQTTGFGKSNDGFYEFLMLELCRVRITQFRIYMVMPFTTR